jgi:hypothetical protein
MSKRTKFFHAVQSKTSVVGDGTVGDLMDWTEKLVNILFPENGIEYWADNKYGVFHNELKRFHKLPVSGCNEMDIAHVACYAYTGSCEGRRININLQLRDGTMKSLFSAKTFGSDDETGLIVRAICLALESIFFYEDLPLIVEMANKIPRQYNWHRETSLTEVVSIITTESTLSVVTPSGLILDKQDWSVHGANAKFCVEAYVKDWKTVLSNMKVIYTEVTGSELVVADLPA